ncbi:MAG TPA: UDP-N-acetylmuramate dehydrogenase [Candidatus Paceibacterota bacterium]
MTIQENISLKDLTTFRTGGTARFFAVATTVDDIREAVLFAEKNTLPMLVLGGGSNILVSDEGFNGLVLKIEIKGITWNTSGADALVTVGAGENWDDFVAACVSRELYGLENLSYIPGTVGAAPIQNIGAYGVEVKYFIASVIVFDTNNKKVTTLTNAECNFSYRDSFFKKLEGKHFVVAEVVFKLKKHATLNTSYKDVGEYARKHSIGEFSLATLREAIIDIRKNKLPDWHMLGTAGSFFKNPIISKEHYDELLKKYPDLPGFPLPATSYKLQAFKIPLAWIIDNICGFRGKRVGDVGTYRNQALVLVNYGEATTKEVMSFAQAIIDDVKEKTGIVIEPEVQMVGKFAFYGEGV